MNSTALFCIDPDYLNDLATKYKESYAQAQPFPHIVIDNFLPEFVLDEILTEFSYHGHPEPLTCPEGRTRKSLALYYYSNGRPAEEIAGAGHSTLFKTRPDEKFTSNQSSGTKVKTFVKKLIPPILIDVRNHLSQKS
ncbi:MAG: hypothetical protein RID09_31295 [Coleofasciculus sp. G1-WW12-02]|uniref:hypothetical protein n=1 Tax=Coleofasciculus sp. G1-WW12-02 TaxID=3068483 RepID=UPI0032F3F14E